MPRNSTRITHEERMSDRYAPLLEAYQYATDDLPLHAQLQNFGASRILDQYNNPLTNISVLPSTNPTFMAGLGGPKYGHSERRQLADIYDQYINTLRQRGEIGYNPFQRDTLINPRRLRSPSPGRYTHATNADTLNEYQFTNQDHVDPIQRIYPEVLPDLNESAALNKLNSNIQDADNHTQAQRLNRFMTNRGDKVDIFTERPTCSAGDNNCADALDPMLTANSTLKHSFSPEKGYNPRFNTAEYSQEKREPNRDQFQKEYWGGPERYAGGGRVQLTPEEARIAQVFNMTPEEYKRLQRARFGARNS